MSAIVYLSYNFKKCRALNILTRISFLVIPKTMHSFYAKRCILHFKDHFKMIVRGYLTSLQLRSAGNKQQQSINLPEENCKTFLNVENTKKYLYNLGD